VHIQTTLKSLLKTNGNHLSPAHYQPGYERTNQTSRRFQEKLIGVQTKKLVLPFSDVDHQELPNHSCANDADEHDGKHEPELWEEAMVG